MSAYTSSCLDAVERLPSGGTLVLQNVSWEEYDSLRDELENFRKVRVIYDRGRIEIMAPLREHETWSRFVHDMVRVLARSLGLRLESSGAMTMKSISLGRGVEPDESFYVEHAQAAIGMREFVHGQTSPPDVVVEIDVTNESLHKLPIYAALGVPEIWRYDGAVAEIYLLLDDDYLSSSASLAFPFLTPDVLARFLLASRTEGQDEALRTFSVWVDQNKPAE
jgi:Uma2 family endonuclease